MEIINKKVEELIPYENNPRFNDDAVEYVANSIKEFGFKVPIVIDKDNVIVAGHTRYKASMELGLTEVPCIVADDLNEEQIKAFRLADNKVSEKAEWDFELLDEELNDLDIDMEQFGFDSLEVFENPYNDNPNEKNLQERFLAPPFSIIDTRQKYWQDRKRMWKEYGIKSDEGRAENLLGGGLLKLAQKTGSDKTLTGTSIFDPALCETMYLWFNIEGGKIFDPFAGGSVRGIVATKLGYDYTGIDLSSKQIEANKKNAEELGLKVKWYNDDSLNCDKYVEDNSVDMIFSCPPYADLEKYSDDPRDLSNMDYEDFKTAYFEIIKKACKKLKNDRFAVFVVGDVRDKEGFYYNFVDDTKKAFIDGGMKFYNEIILVNAVGTASLRAGKIFSTGRKVCKTHQNVLVFYKGDPKKIKENYVETDLEDIIKEQVEKETMEVEE